MLRLKACLVNSAAALVLFTSVSPATAEIISSTYEGTLFNSFDTTGVFGGANSSLDGMAVHLTFSVDTSKGNYSIGPWGNRTEGGTWYNAQSPLSVVITINGHSELLLGSTESFNQVVNGHHRYRAIDDFETNTVRHFYQMVADLDSPSGLLSNSILSPYSGAAGVDPMLTGSFAFNERYTHIEDVIAHGTDNLVLVYGQFTSGAIQAPVAAIPEPETYVMLLAGLVLLGFQLRRRKKEAAEG